ncbi:hypothetical protein [Parapedobacter sp. 10938]|uniref:hypothetical protein n=1 Tax=Parapedobacter flavus TaxID=3110225 RepID=UPI002DBE80D2|nr:hypothetical protein [Parapedobacter sp. 10938]MEC3879170.1 hypothetical protein [Parapedobacter sp. 10938]
MVTVWSKRKLDITICDIKLKDQPMPENQTDAVKTLMIADEVVINKIHFIREQKVILDSDLAERFRRLP